MTAAWAVQALLVGLLLSVAGIAAERAAGWLGLPRRPVWGAALFGTAGLAWISLVAPAAIPELGLLPNGPGALANLNLAGAGAAISADDWLVRASRGVDPETFRISTILLAAWVSASATLLMLIGWTCYGLSSLRAASKVAHIDGVAVRIADTAGPAVVGVLQPAIVLPRWVVELPTEERRLIVLHEREHLAARDNWLLLASTVAVSLLPWCVFLWWQHLRLRQAIETDCDARVLARGANLQTYGRILIRTASSNPRLPVLNPAWGESTSQLERRIMTMTTRRPRRPLLRSIPLVALALATVATACDVAGRSGSRADLATAPAASGLDTVLVQGSGSGAAGGDIGIQGMSWPDHGGPSFGAGTPRPPTRHPVIRVHQGGSAWNAGLRDGDVLLEVNGRDTRSVVFPFADRTPGTTYSVRVRRGMEELIFSLAVGPAAAAPGGM